MSRDPVPLRDSLNSVVKALRPDDSEAADIAAVGGVFERWTEAVGGPIAAHVHPVRLDGTTLVVQVDEPAWATQVKFFTDTIIRRLDEVAGARIETLVVRVSPDGARPC